MMCTVTIAVYIANRIQHTNTPNGYNADISSIKPDGTYAATRLRGIAMMGRMAWPPRAAASRGGGGKLTF